VTLHFRPPVPEANNDAGYLREKSGKCRRWARRRCGCFCKKSKRNTERAQRIWVMDRGIPTEEVLAEMREADPPVS
jgi:trehalose utilization protein